MQFTVKLVSTIALAAAMANALAFPRQEAGTYTLTFTGKEAATQGHDFITFGLFDTATECTAFCDSVEACGFANSYHDNNGKGGSPQLTCSLYSGCHDESDLFNTGGQTQPDGSVNFITDSDGWCKVTQPADPTTTEPADPTPTEPADPTPTEPVDPTPTEDPEPTPTETVEDPAPTETGEPTEA